MSARGSGGDGRPDDGRETVDLQLLTFNDFHGYLQPPTGGDATLGAHAPVAPPPTDRINELP